jgi:hypothetical protein
MFADCTGLEGPHQALLRESGRSGGGFTEKASVKGIDTLFPHDVSYIFSAIFYAKLNFSIAPRAIFDARRQTKEDG